MSIRTNHLRPDASVDIAERAHIRTLDGLRGLAILMVLIIHFYPKALIADVYPTLTMIAGRLVSVGAYGVELFFVLSGFLITGILIDTRNERHSLLKFYARRVLRIFPLYYGSLIIVLLVLPMFVRLDAGASSIVDRQAWLWTYMVNWPEGWIWDESNLYKLGHFWSLCVEEHFYLFWPAVVALLSTQRLFSAALALVSLSLLSRSIAAMAGPGSIPILEWSSLQKLDGLAIGAIVAIALRTPSLSNFLPSGTAFRRAFGVIMAASVVYVFLPRRLYLPVFYVIGETLMVMFFGLVLLATLRCRAPEKAHAILSSGVLVTLGKYSYGIYVIHGILRPAFYQWFDLSRLPKAYGLPLLYVAIYYALSIAVSVALAYLSFHLFEKYFLNLKRYFEYEARPKATPSRQLHKAAPPSLRS